MKFTIKQARKYKGYSQEALANMLHIPKPTYYNYEHGRSVMRVDTAQKFADIVGIPFNQIIFYNETTEKM